MSDPSPGDSDVLFGKLIVEQGLAKQDQVDECLQLKLELLDKGVSPAPRLGELLIRKGYLTEKQVERTVRISEGSSGKASTAVPELPKEAAVRS